jgi:uncharacterized membrane protein YfcA
MPEPSLFSFDALTPALAAMLWLTALLAGLVDAIAGGGGLLSIPALMWAGLTPHQALATNKLQAVFGSFSATLHYTRAGLVDLPGMAVPYLMTFCGSALGGLAVQQIDAGLLAGLLPVMLIAFALYFLFSPRVGAVDAQHRIGIVGFACSAGFGIGFYDGFFGPGTGSFFALAFIALLGFNLRKATGHAKLLNFASNLAALLVFTAGGQILWGVGLLMASGQILGSWLGAHLAVRHGGWLIRPMLVAVSTLMALRLLAD